jgi:hypothetical protein
LASYDSFTSSKWLSNKWPGPFRVLCSKKGITLANDPGASLRGYP